MVIIAYVLTYCKKLYLQRDIFSSFFRANGATDVREFILLISAEVNMPLLLNILKTFEVINLFNNTLKKHFSNYYCWIDILKKIKSVIVAVFIFSKNNKWMV